MREVTVSATISAPRAQVFDFVCDLAARPSFTDHYMEDYRLARVQPVGVGAAARFKLGLPLGAEYAELTITKADRPRQIIEEIRVGRRGREHDLHVARQFYLARARRLVLDGDAAHLRVCRLIQPAAPSCLSRSTLVAGSLNVVSSTRVTCADSRVKS